jgi:hypothetical protein
MKMTRVLPVVGSMAVLALAGAVVALGGCSSDNLLWPSEPFELVASTSVDGPAGGADQARGMALGPDGNIYAAGGVAVAGQDLDIWIGKYDAGLNPLTSTTLNGSADGEDIGCVLAFDGSGYLYLVGYLSEAGQDHNIWLAKYDTDLVLQDQVTVNGSGNSTDDGYGLLYDGAGTLYVAGTVTETGQGYNVWLAKYDTSLNLLDSTTLNGPGNNTDKARFMALDGSGNLFVSGSVTQTGTDYDLWLGKFDTDLNLLDQVIVVGPTADEDKGYELVYDGAGTLYVTGTLTNPGQGFDIWLAKYDTELNELDSVTLSGPANGEDVAYTMVLEGSHLYLTGVYTELAGGSNVWIARFGTDLSLQASTTVNGSANGYDSGIGIIRGPGADLYVSALMTELTGGLNIWLARYRI